jgi:hypothetical protein
VGLLLVDQLPNELEEVGDVPGHQAAALAGCVPELLESLRPT